MVDAVFEPDALERPVRPLAHPAVGALSGNTKVGNRRALFPAPRDDRPPG